MNLLDFSVCLGTYYFLHSFLADDTIKSKLQCHISMRYYRIIYNLLMLVLLGVLLAYYLKMEKVPFFNLSNPYLKWTGALFIASGIIWSLFSLKGYDLGEFTGWKQLTPKTSEHKEHLKTDGLNAYVRHPLYFGTLLILWGFFLTSPHQAALALAAISTLYIFVGSRLEERKLILRFGNTYLDYQQRVPMLLPKLHRK